MNKSFETGVLILLMAILLALCAGEQRARRQPLKEELKLLEEIIFTADGYKQDGRPAEWASRAAKLSAKLPANSRARVVFGTVAIEIRNWQERREEYFRKLKASNAWTGEPEGPDPGKLTAALVSEAQKAREYLIAIPAP